MTTTLLLADPLYRPPLGIGWIVVGVGLALAAAALAMLSERARWTTALRLVGLAGLAWLLMGPSETRPGTPSNAQPPRLAVLVDTSVSMAEEDVAASPGNPQVSRLQAVTDRWLSDEALDALRRFAEVEVRGFDEQISVADGRPLLADGEATRLWDALEQTDADATLILSDGHDTTGRLMSANDVGEGSAGRLFAVPVGAPRSAPDLALQAWVQSDRLFEDQATTLTVTLRQRGFEGRKAAVELLHNGEVIERVPLTLDRSGEQKTFTIKPPLATGMTVEAHHYRARIALDDGEEAYTANNAEDVFVQVSRGRVKVLLLEGEPYWDTRSLARLIGSHPRFELTTVFGFGEQRRTRSFGESIDPSTDPVNSLDAFDIVVLGRRIERMVDAGFADRLNRFARDGGAVVFARGLPFDPDDDTGRQLLAGVEPISPVAWAQPVVGEMRVRLGNSTSERGPLADLQDSAVLSRLPGMLAATRIEGRKAASLVLLQQQAGDDGPAMAALTTLRVGSGVTMAVLTEGLWRWELLPGVGEDAQAESVYGMFWIRAMQWLASGGAFLPGQDVALEADRLGVEPGENVNLTVSTRYIETAGLKLQLAAIGPDGLAQGVNLDPSTTPGRFAASFTPQSPGVYRFELTAPGRDDLIDPQNPLTTRLAAIERSAERRDTSARPELLKQLTEPTGGRCLELDETQPLLDYLQTLQALRQASPGVDYHFNTWPVFAWIAGCFGLEWILRRRSGLR